MADRELTAADRAAFAKLARAAGEIARGAATAAVHMPASDALSGPVTRLAVHAAGMAERLAANTDLAVAAGSAARQAAEADLTSAAADLAEAWPEAGEACAAAAAQLAAVSAE